MTGLAPMEPLSEGAEEHHMLTRVEEVSITNILHLLCHRKMINYLILYFIMIPYIFT